MKKRTISYLGTCAVMAAGLAAISISAQAEAAVTGTYKMVVDSFDPAAYSTDMILTLDQAVDVVSPDDFAVSESKMEWNYAAMEMEEVFNERVITDAFLCDADGAKAEGPSEYVAISMKPSSACKSVFGSVGAMGLNSWETTYALHVTLADGAAVTAGGEAVEGLVIDPKFTDVLVSESVGKFDTEGTYTSASGVTYRYASYSPEEGSDTLVVWLHGLGEGGTVGTDPRIILLAAEADELAGDIFQSKIKGAHILAPQCPTWWMDPNGKGEVLDGSSVNSFYAESLDEFIDSYAEEVGADKIVVAGCSNGGYMTMVMALRNPDKYAAIVPICEALQYSEDLNASLDTIKDLPMYFVYSKDDPLVVPEVYEIPTIAYLTGIGATNLHTSVTEHVFASVAEEAPAMQFGHASWIYFFNNETADENGVSAWDWLAENLSLLGGGDDASGI